MRAGGRTERPAELLPRFIVLLLAISRISAMIVFNFKSESL